MEYFGIGAGLYDIGEVLAVGIGDEDLSELLALHHRYDAFYAFAIQSVEDIIEQEDRRFACCIG